MSVNVNQMKLMGHFRQIKQDAIDALQALPKGERVIHIFWLLGPFFLLIERSPADLWLSVLVLCFLYRSVKINDWKWFHPFWVKAAFLFWGITIISGLMSVDPLYSVGEAVIWMRFPLFAIATWYWFSRDKRLLYAMLVSTLFGLIIMCGILSAEVLIEGQKGGRLSWPYGDLVPGNYVAKVGLPVFTVMVALAVSAPRKIATPAAIIALFTLLISVMTGERINFLIRACAGMLAGILWRPNFKRYAALVAIEVLAVVVAFQAIPDMGYRYVDHFVSQLPTGDHSAYYRTMMPGVVAFMQEPLWGVGTANLRNLCPEITMHLTQIECHPHPHNYYLQMAGETGIFGLITGTIFLWSIIWYCFKASLKNRDNVVLVTAWVVPFGLFWPIASTADFFGQWNNIFMWSAIALAIGASNLAPNKIAKKQGAKK